MIFPKKKETGNNTFSRFFRFPLLGASASPASAAAQEEEPEDPVERMKRMFASRGSQSLELFKEPPIGRFFHFFCFQLIYFLGFNGFCFFFSVFQDLFVF